MKKYFILFALVILNVSNNIELFAKPINLETAKMLGSNFLKQPVEHLTESKTGDDLQSSDIAYYILQSETGFVIIAGDDRVNPIIGYSHNNPFSDINNMPPALKFWLDNKAEQIRYAVENQIPVSIEMERKWQELYSGKKSVSQFQSGDVEPLIKTKWDQDNNSLTPGSSPTGCTNTAMAQIMRYWE